MSDPRPEENNRENTGEGFVRERIVTRASGKRVLRKLLLTGVCAVLFGLLAGITIAAVLPMASGWFSSPETPPPITIPKDEYESSGESSEETTQESESSSEETADQTETPSGQEGLSEDEIRKLLEALLKEHASDPAMVEKMQRAMTSFGKTYNKAVVTVVVKTVETDQFENPVHTAGETAGIIWNEGTDGSLYILTCAKKPEDGTEIQIRFNDGTRAAAEVCQADESTGLMVIKVSAEQIDETLKSKIRVLSLGNSYGVSVGKPLLVLGAPVGEIGAIVPAIVTYTDGELISADSIYREIYLDCTTVEGSIGFVISLEGEIMGIVTPSTSGSVTAMVGISDLKGVLELLANGKQVPYLGIMGQAVTTELAQTYQLPFGVYVNDVIVDSPVYRVGIKAGDVVVKINETDVTTVRGLKSIVEGLQSDETVTITVKRKGNDGYQELQFELEAGLR